MTARVGTTLENPGTFPDGPALWGTGRMDQRPSDSELLTRARGGDSGAFRQLIDRHKDLMVRYLTRMTGSRERAEELAQEGFVRLYMKPPRLEGEQATVAPWLYRVTTNLLRTEDRRARRTRMVAWLLSGGARPVVAAPGSGAGRAPATAAGAATAWRGDKRPTVRLAHGPGSAAASLAAGVLMASAPDQEALLLADEAQRQTQAALAALPVLFRAPLVLREIEGLSYEEIAQALHCPLGTVRSRINRGRELLREQLAPYHHGAQA